MILGLVLALVLIGIGVGLLGGNEDSSPVSSNPKAMALCEKGTDAAHAFKLRDAIRMLGESLELDPSLAEASIARAYAFARLGEMDHYKTELARADSLTGLIEDDRRRMLAQLRLSGHHDSSYRAIGDSILTALDMEIPEDIYVLSAKAAVAARTGTPDEVEQAWKRILEVNPNHAVSYNMLGYLELNRGNYDQAIEYMQKYAFLAPDMANPHDSLGEIYMVIGRYEDAQQEFKKSIEMQPDFYYSIINFGKVFLARGQLDTGLEILEKVRTEVKGSMLEMQVDREIIGTYLAAGLDEDLGRTVAEFVTRYPESDMSPVYRAVSLAYQGRFFEGRAIMDSTLAVWRSGESYKIYPNAKANIDRTDAMFEAIAADVAHDHASAELYWAKTTELFTNKIPLHERWYFKFRYASALHDNGKPRKALAVIDPILAVNNRLINLLILKTQAHVVLGEAEAARSTLKQLQFSLQKADKDFPARTTAQMLEVEVSDLAVKD